MQYSPKLKVAMEQIKKIIADNDIGAMVFLHQPGYGEYYSKIDPGYSIAKLENNFLTVKTKPDDTKEEKLRMISNTLDMVKGLTEMMIINQNILREIANMIKTKFIVDTTIEGHSSHDQQNN